MRGKKSRIFQLFSYLAAGLLLAAGVLYFRELFYHAGRASFFTFRLDFLSGFMPWNAQHNMYPGEEHGLLSLLEAFTAQFYRGWGVWAVILGGGLLFCLFFTWICRKCFRFARKTWVLCLLPLFWAGIFLLVQLSLALRSTEHLGFRHHKMNTVLWKTERLLSEQRYAEALQTANAWWFAHPCPINDVVTGQNTLYAGLSEAEILFRIDLAAYTRVALLGAGRLNNDFFTYYRVPEIYNAIEDNISRQSYRCDVFRGRLTGNHPLAYSQAMNVMETEGLSYDMLERSVFSALVCAQYGLADKYIRLLKGTLFYRRQAALYEQAAQVLRNPGKKVSDPEVAVMVGEIQEERERAPKDYIYEPSGEGEARELWRQSPCSIENLERVALADLLYKNTDKVVLYIPVWLRLKAQKPPYVLPGSWQEMLYMLSRENPGQLDSIASIMDQIGWDNGILKQCELFYQARERLLRRSMSPQQITQSFGHTFLYNYYFSRFVSPVGHEAEKTLAH